MVVKRCVTRAVAAPIRAAAVAASQPAWPPPITMTSKLARSVRMSGLLSHGGKSRKWKLRSRVFHVKQRRPRGQMNFCENNPMHSRKSVEETTVSRETNMGSPKPTRTFARRSPDNPGRSTKSNMASCRRRRRPITALWTKTDGIRFVATAPRNDETESDIKAPSAVPRDARSRRDAKEANRANGGVSRETMGTAWSCFT